MKNTTNIVLVVTASIAAYRVLELVRLLSLNDCFVECILTRSSREFITATSISSLSKSPVYVDSDCFDTNYNMIHIELAIKADYILVVPASANIISKIANGIADDLASTFLLAAHDKPIFIVPAMNPKMWRNKALQRNVSLLREDGLNFIGPEKGNLACGENGIGRMSTPESIFEVIKAHLSQ